MKINWDELTFSVTPTKTMFVAKCNIGESWDEGEFVPYGNISISPAAGVLNYGQGLFEGMKAYRTSKGNIGIFRPMENVKRANMGCRRLLMPEVSEKLFWKAVKGVVKANEEYIPPIGKGALYIRPVIWGTGPVLGVGPAPEYTFLIFVSPVGPYFRGAMAGIHLKISKEFHRAPQFGTGGIKAIGNYAGSMYPAKQVKAEGFSEVVYLDAREETYLEEVGAANLFLIKGKTLITPELDGSILPGITRKSIMQMAEEEFGYIVEERKVNVQEIFEADESFCSGTAAVITPILSMTFNQRKQIFSDGNVGEKTLILYNGLREIQREQREDKYGWLTTI